MNVVEIKVEATAAKLEANLEKLTPEIDLKSMLSKGWVSAENPSRPRKSPQYHPVILKLELLSQGLVVSPEAAEEIGKSLKVDHAVGAVGKHALDIILDPGKVYVGLPVGTTVSDH